MKVLILIAFVASINAAILPSMPSLGGSSSGGLSYFEILRLLNNVYNSPIGKLMPPFTEMVSLAISLNRTATSANDSWTKISALLKETAEKATAQIAESMPSNFNITSLINNLPKPNMTNLILPSAFPTLMPAMPSLSPLIPTLIG